MVDAVEQIGHGKAGGKLRSQIVDDQEVTVQDHVRQVQILLASALTAAIPKALLFQQAAQLVGGLIEHCIALIQNFFGDAVTQKGLACAGGAVK